MFRNTIKLALRNIFRHRSFFLINVIGLAVGMACFFIILAYVQNELSYDRFHEKRDQIFRLMRTSIDEGRMDTSSYLPSPLAPALLSEFPEIQSAVRFSQAGWVPVTYKDKGFVERRILLADPSFFKVFSFPLVRGEPERGLPDKYSVVITEDTAVKYFGNEDPIGKILVYDNRIDLKVAAVARNLPPNTDFKFGLLIPFELINEIQGFNYLGSWGAFNFSIYVLAQKNISHSDFEKKSQGLGHKYRPADSADYDMLHSLFLQPVDQTHLESNTRLYIYIFSAIGVVILLLACINFMNLSVAQSSAREKEVGMRKVIGASQFQLVRQFLGESISLSVIALPLAVCLVEFLLPVYNRIFNIKLSINYVKNWPFSLGVIGTAILVGIISGGYPAFYSSAIRPIKSLKSAFGPSSRRTILRSALVVFQFAMSLILIIGTIIIRNQLDYIRNKSLGFNKEHVINLHLYDRGLRQNYETFKAELLKNPKIISASGNYFMSRHWNNTIHWEGEREGDNRMMPWFMVDADFLETYQIELVEGRNFQKGSGSDLRFAYLLNETAVKAMGWSSAVGKGFEVERYGSQMGTVVGVVKDFHFESLRQKIQPLAICMFPTFGTISVRVASDNIPDTLEFIRKKQRELAPSAPFEYYFLDADIDDIYRTEQVMSKIFSHFSLLAIFIACLGLLGLTSYSIVQRTREVGIRKVLGASTAKITILLIKEFIKWVVVANLIAWPLAYFAMSRWLEIFAYRISIGFWIFILSGVLALVIAIATVSFQAVKAALANPVDALRYE
jgi:putative ABC transport system permease protein